MTVTGQNAMSAVTPFETLEACTAHANHLFSDFTVMREPEHNHYHLLDSLIHYMEFGEGNWVASWACVPEIPYETK